MLGAKSSIQALTDSRARRKTAFVSKDSASPFAFVRAEPGSSLCTEVTIAPAGGNVDDANRPPLLMLSAHSLFGGRFP